MKYSRKFLEYLKKKIDIMEVIKDELGGDVKFKKVGFSDFLILCPFHQEKKRSFRIHLIYEGYYVYRCFGCQRGGDVVRFIMSLKNLSFNHAIKYLTKKYKIAGCK